MNMMPLFSVFLGPGEDGDLLTAVAFEKEMFKEVYGIKDMNEFTRKVEDQYGEQIKELTIGIFEMMIEEKKEQK